MARIRTIKPEFFTSEDIVALSPMARLLYIALWCEADREGRLAWKPKTFKMRYLPADNCEVDDLCSELVDGGLVKLYGDGLAFIPSFGKHQHLNPREAASTLADPHACPTRAPRVPDATVTVKTRDSDAQVGREGKGRECISRVAASEGRFPDFWAAWPNTTRKADRKKCLAKWQRLGCDAEADAILAHVAALKATRQWVDGFEPAPLTYLNGERWHDGVDVRSESATDALFDGVH